MKHIASSCRAITTLLVLIILLACLTISASAAAPFTLVNSGGTATGTFTVTDFKLSQASGTAFASPTDTLNQWDSLKVEMAFTLSESGFPEDSTTVIKLPDDLDFGTLTAYGILEFNLIVDGSTTVPPDIFAQAVVNPTAKTITLTYTDYPNDKANVRGQLSFWIMASELLDSDATEITFNNSFFNSGIVIGYEYAPENAQEVCNKWGNVLWDSDSKSDGYGQYYLAYGMRLNISGELAFNKIEDIITLPTEYKNCRY